MITLKQMMAFRELMRCGTVSEAAKNLHRTQPAISHLIASLEADVGMKLFERRGGRMQAVPEANYLLEECDAVLRRIDLIAENLERLKSMETGELRVVSMLGPSVFLMPEMVTRFTPKHSGVKATVLSRSSNAVRQLVRSQQYDLGLADYEPENPTEGSLLTVEIFEFDCLCAIPAGHDLAKKSVIEFDDMDDVPIASLFTDHPTRIETERAFANAGAVFIPQFETNHFIMLLSFVRRGLACAIVDPLAAESHRLFSENSELIQFRPLNMNITFSVEKLTPSFRSPSILARSFDDHLRDELLRLGARQVD